MAYIYETSTTYDFKNFDNKYWLYGSVTRDDLGNLYVWALIQLTKKSTRYSQVHLRQTNKLI